MEKLLFKKHANPDLDDLFIIIHNNRVLLRSSDSKLPNSNDFSAILSEKSYLGEFGNKSIYGCLIKDDSSYLNTDKFYFENIRNTYSLVGEDCFWLVGFANQILHFESSHKYCPSCRTKTDTASDSRARVCHDCGFMEFPTISPAIIVAIRKNDKILLGRNKNFKNGMYSVLAGFAEPFESLEDCVEREVFEEVGIKIRNIKYFGSQPWPFPNSLMVGFTAEYESGDIVVDENEIVHADWFKKNELPPIPQGVSISRSLIDDFIESV